MSLILKKLHKYFKFILPLLVFTLSFASLCFIIHKSDTSYIEQLRTKTKLNAVSYADRMIQDLNNGINVTESLQQIVISENGRFNRFDKIAKNLMNESIQSIQIAPNGVVTDIYPEEGNETGKIDLINDESRGEICRYGRDNNVITMQGPFPLNQGGKGIAIRNPVYIENKSGQQTFWGFTITIIHVPEIFENSIKTLSEFGYVYKLSKTSSPLTLSYEQVYSSGSKLENPVCYNFKLGCCSWKLEVMPASGWHDNKKLGLIFVFGCIIVLLLTVLTIALIILEERRQKLKRTSITDVLTGLFNRNGFDEQLEKYMTSNPNESCVAIMLDIDNFKIINDVYGHSAGDFALQQLAKTIKQTFSRNSIYARNGGDEFCIILKNTTCKKAQKQIENFTHMPRNFHYNHEKHSFNISVGYAEFPLHTNDYKKLMKKADIALYEVKLHGKHDCLAYDNSFRQINRTQLGFKLKDFSENLPCAFLVYQADKNNDRILFANLEMIKLAGCNDIDDFFDYTKYSFRNLIAGDERKAVEQNIWEQIINSHSTNDYVKFNFIKKNGTSIPVLDYGHIVHNHYYGDVFYVVIIDFELMKNAYDLTYKLF